MLGLTRENDINSVYHNVFVHKIKYLWGENLVDVKPVRKECPLPFKNENPYDPEIFSEEFSWNSEKNKAG